MKKFFAALLIFATLIYLPLPAMALPGGTGFTPDSCFTNCAGDTTRCDTGCTGVSLTNSEITIEYLRQAFINHRRWLVDVVFAGHVLPAMMLMAEQLTATAMHQVMVIGTLLDAKHQLETQRLFQELSAIAHKDYHPSEGMCTFGTTVRSLAASDRNAELTAMGLSNRVLQRELLSGDSLAGAGRSSDYLSRILQFRDVHCSRGDNDTGLSTLCPGNSEAPGRANNDISYTNVLETPMTLDIDFTPQGDPDHAANLANRQTVSPDEEDVLALVSNLYAHNVAPILPEAFLSDEAGVLNIEGTDRYLDIRAIAAKRSVARNSFAAIASMKAQGEPEVQPYLHAIVREMGIPDEEILAYLGERPSYHAQMEILTKKLYQNPIFYTELIDKPANVERKTVAMQAIELMQRRDMYRSVLRSETILSVMLETALIEQQEKVTNEIIPLREDGDLITLPE